MRELKNPALKKPGFHAGQKKKIKGGENVNTNAAGQLLGYSLQYPRALFHLLHLPSGGSVGIEVLGDVASFLPDGTTLSEEDKSSISSNPLTNRSIDLWKTFYNWITAITNDEIDIEKSKFILYCNKQGHHALVNEFDNAETRNEASEAVKNTIEELKDIKDDHDIYRYYNFVIYNRAIFEKVIQRFELVVGKDAGYEEVKTAIKEKIVHDDFVDYLLEHLAGWLQINITEKIASRTPAYISYKQFHDKFLALFYKIRAKSLINWALQDPPKDEAISKVLKIRPTYVKQLDFISINDDEIVEAVSDFIKADINRNKWIETGVIDEEAAIDFEGRLFSFWNNSKKKIDIVHSSLDEKKKGKLLLLECTSRKEPINNVIPPDRTIPGSYHTLSDRKEIGWHPDWENMINEE